MRRSILANLAIATLAILVPSGIASLAQAQTRTSAAATNDL